MSFQFGSTQQQQKQQATQAVQLPVASPEEAELRRINLDLARRQQTALIKADQDQAAFAASPLAAIQRQIEQKASENILNRLTGKAPVLAPEEQARLDQIFKAAQDTGEEDLQRFAQQQANARGLALSDSPIGGETVRQRRVFGQQLAGQKAASALDLGQAAANFNQALAQFQSGLQQQGFLNRLAMAQAQPASLGLQNSLFAQRLAAAPRTSSGTGSLFGNTSGYGFSGSDVQGYGTGLKALGIGF